MLTWFQNATTTKYSAKTSCRIQKAPQRLSLYQATRDFGLKTEHIQAAIDQFLVEVCISEKSPEDFDAFVQNLYDNFNLQLVIDEVTAAAAE